LTAENSRGFTKTIVISEAEVAQAQPVMIIVEWANGRVEAMQHQAAVGHGPHR